MHRVQQIKLLHTSFKLIIQAASFAMHCDIIAHFIVVIVMLSCIGVARSSRSRVSSLRKYTLDGSQVASLEQITDQFHSLKDSLKSLKESILANEYLYLEYEEKIWQILTKVDENAKNTEVIPDFLSMTVVRYNESESNMRYFAIEYIINSQKYEHSEFRIPMSNHHFSDGQTHDALKFISLITTLNYQQLQRRVSRVMKLQHTTHSNIQQVTKNANSTGGSNTAAQIKHDIDDLLPIHKPLQTTPLQRLFDTDSDVRSTIHKDDESISDLDLDSSLPQSQICTQYHEKDKIISSLQLKIHQLENDTLAARQQVSSMHAMILKLRENISDVYTKHAQTSSQNIWLNQELDEVLTELDHLSNDVYCLQAKNDILNQQLAQTKIIQENLNKTINDLSNKTFFMTQRIAQLTQQNQDLLNQVAQGFTTVMNGDEIKHNLTKENLLLTEHNKNLMAYQSQLINSNNQLKTKTRTLKQETNETIQNLQTNITKLNFQIQEYENTTQIIQATLNECKAKSHNKDRMISNLTNQTTMMTIQIATVKTANQQLLKNQSELTTQVSYLQSNLTSQIRNATQAHEELLDLNVKHAKLIDEKEIIRKKNGILTSSLLGGVAIFVVFCITATFQIQKWNKQRVDDVRSFFKRNFEILQKTKNTKLRNLNNNMSTINKQKPNQLAITEIDEFLAQLDNEMQLGKTSQYMTDEQLEARLRQHFDHKLS